MARANPQGRGPQRAPNSPRDRRQSANEPSKPTGKPPRPLATPGGDPSQAGWGDHLQGSKPKR